MRDGDIKRLASATRTSALNDPEALALAALGIPLPNLERLETAVLKDLSITPPYGISWWKDSIPTGDRIAISDQLYACIQCISENLIEAQLHWLEFLEWRERANEFASNYSRARNRTALEILVPKLKSMHEAGVIRSLCSSLDCLAGAIIVINALDMNVLKANLLKVKSEFNQLHE